MSLEDTQAASDVSSSTFTIWVNCPYKERCTDRGGKCKSCKHEPNRSYYEPVDTPYYEPSYPYYTPYYIDYGPTCTTFTQSYYAVK